MSLSAVNLAANSTTSATTVGSEEAWIEERANEVDASVVASSGAKRLFDVALSAVALLFFLPVLLMAAVAIKLDSRGPVLFRQRRTGLSGQVFWIYKLRTMRVQEDGADIKHAAKNDDRITRVGALLRKTSVDELPQLLNVLKGDMSMIGPRPHALSHDQRYEALVGGYRQRFRARPGLTGLAQVEGHRGEIHTLDCMEKRVASDNAYIERWSIGLDITILLRTVPLVLRDPNAY
jgi:putative colanic acid biosynthesis UDP-glucose lipid carrier transferase